MKIACFDFFCRCCMESAKKAAPWIEGRMWKSGASKKGTLPWKDVKIAQCAFAMHMPWKEARMCTLSQVSPHLSVPLFLTHLSSCFLPIYPSVSCTSNPLCLAYLSPCFSPIYPSTTNPLPGKHIALLDIGLWIKTDFLGCFTMQRSLQRT